MPAGALGLDLPQAQQGGRGDPGFGIGRAHSDPTGQDTGGDGNELRYSWQGDDGGQITEVTYRLRSTRSRVRERIGVRSCRSPRGCCTRLEVTWSTVHVADLADFFRRVLEDDSARGYYVVGNGLNATVAELTEAAAVAAGAPGAVPGSDDEARARLGDYFAEVLLLDQGTVAARARADLGWRPTHPGLVDEFRTGSYHHGRSAVMDSTSGD